MFLIFPLEHQHLDPHATSTMTTNFIAIADVNVTFVAHPMAPKAHIHLNNFYGGLLPDLTDLFTDDTKIALKDNVIDLIQSQLIDDLIIPTASQTADPTIIAPLLKAGLFKVSYGNKPATRLTKKSLHNVMHNLILSKTIPATIEVTITVGHLYFPPEPTYLDWGVFSTTPIASNASTTPATLPMPGSPVLTYTDMTSAITSAIAGINKVTTAAPPIGSSTATSTRYIFNPAGLPSDVHAAYKARQANQVIMRSRVGKPFADGY